MSEQIFAGTARYYSLYRPRYPQVLLDYLIASTVGDHGHAMVDWGCGTGEVSLRLCHVFDETVAIDIDREMIAVAKEKAAQEHVANVSWLVGKVEDISLRDDYYDLIVAGSSFHWMDRELLSERAFRSLTRSGALALIGGGSDVWDIKCPWHEVAVRVIKRWLGDKRRAGGGSYTVTKQHSDFLVPAGFKLELKKYRVDHIWTTDSIIGYLYSTSFANPALFGNHREEFERDLHLELAGISTDDSFPEVLDFYLYIAVKH